MSLRKLDNILNSYKNVQSLAKAMLAGKLIPLNVYFRKQEGAQISDLSFHLTMLRDRDRARENDKPRTNIGRE
jgi:hypothetical protein